MSQMSDLMDCSLRRSVEWAYVVDAVDALLRDNEAQARAALIEGAEAAGWSAIGHRLAVAGRGLLADDGLTAGTVDLERAAVILGDVTDLASAWLSLVAVAELIAQAGFPAEVVI